MKAEIAASEFLAGFLDNDALGRLNSVQRHPPKRSAEYLDAVPSSD
jgi:hypothetical protein